MNGADHSKGGRRRVSLMMIAAFLTLPLGPVRAQSPLDKAQQDDVFWSAKGDPEMVRAIRKARETLDGFLKLAEAPPPATRAYSVKIGLKTGEGSEYVWIAPFTRTDDRFIGRVNNTPRIATTYRRGDEVPFSRAEIIDWTYQDGERTRGNYTSCPLIAKASKAEREAFLKHYGMTCEY